MSAKRKNDDEPAEQKEKKRQQLLSEPTDKKEENSVLSTYIESLGFGKNFGDDDDDDDDDDEVEQECDECGGWTDSEEAVEHDGSCYECHAMIKVDRIRGKLPNNFTIQKVSGTHRKPCSECGSNEWDVGDWYVVDCIQPWGTDKYCLDCADSKNWGGSSNDDDNDY
mmetsp:Transcript_15411/g.17263  ORF Transcript_15411/g.17263 Transcript_15411/m.17263 type:complete len:167 (+) Transcript_15411:83-583(+)